MKITWETWRLAVALCLAFLIGGVIASTRCHAQQIAAPKPTPVNLGRDMTPTTEHVKPPVVPPVVKVTIKGGGQLVPPPKLAPVKLGEPVKDGARW